MTYEQVVAKVKAKFADADASKIDGVVALQINLEGKNVNGIFYIEVKDHNVNVEPYEYYDRDVKFIATADDFMKIAYGSLNPVFAFTTGRLQVDGDIDKALLFQKIVEKPKKKKKAKAKKVTA